ncbi:MAG TPA: amidohydrolase family protein [Longimicrobiales bacterium]
MAEVRCYTADWVLPVSSPPIAGGALLVDAQGRIAEVGPAAEIAAVGGRRIDLGAAILLPGLINVHAHPELSAFRGLLDDLPFHQWIPALVRSKHSASLGFDDYLAAARWTCIESLRAGVTTIGATEDSGAAVQALREARMRGVVYLEVFGPDPAQVDSSMLALEQKLQSFASQAGDRVRLGISPHAPYTVSDDLYAAVARYARSQALPLATHAAEAEAEDLLLREAVGPFAAGLRSRGISTTVRAASTIALLQRTGVMECAPLLIHALRLTDEDMRVAADWGATVAHCPIANARLGHGIARVVELRNAGVNVALGTDSVASNNRLDILEEAHVAQMLQRARLQSASALPSAELLRMATIDGARALGMADRTGSLEKGKDADFCVVSLEHPHNVPAPNPLDALFHSARGTDVIMTVVRGEELYANGVVSNFDIDALRAQMKSIGARLQRVRAEA